MMQRQRHLDRPLVRNACRLLLGGVFLISGLAKLPNPHLFADAVGAFHLMPRIVLLEAALFMLWAELLIAALLLMGSRVREAATIGAGLLALFSFAIATALLRGLNVSCGCFGPLSDGPLSWLTLLRTGLLLVIALILMRR